MSWLFVLLAFSVVVACDCVFILFNIDKKGFVNFGEEVNRKELNFFFHLSTC